ncbi:MAG: bifunctional oligoribonuclease/PAP phosphatase NrnA [Fusobacteria bacterium]|nr:bifunctional oligoribonuclease/PAP phosphatase NrnA [Fusobacteriota bacterium]
MDLIRKQFRAAKKILITTHVGPDADGVGCAIALQELLIDMGISVSCIEILLHDEIPENIRFLDKRMSVKKVVNSDFEKFFDTVVILDVGTLDRIGNIAKFVTPKTTLIHFDHHISREKLTHFAMITEDASSTAEVLYNWIRLCKLSVNQIACEALYAALIHDTGNFLYNNVTVETLQFAQFLKNLHFDAENISRRVLYNKSFATLKLLGIALSRLKLSSDGLASTYLMLKDIEEVKAHYNDTDPIIEVLNNLENAKIILFLKEKEPNVFKASIRTKEYDVESISRDFGGGGHIKAAGFTTSKPIYEVVSIVSEKFKEQLRGKRV